VKLSVNGRKSFRHFMLLYEKILEKSPPYDPLSREVLKVINRASK
jgi:hypothetical protein